ncbi:MAG TPA: aldo/keto reductase [Pirellulaceae bacterium]|nr:aldo/keto reductase [Pirellulaceae bacterium]
MQYRSLGSTGVQVSELSFGCGPVPALLTGDDRPRQLGVVGHALERGVNWFDTAAGYGQGASEQNLGDVLAVLGAGDDVHVATKVRLVDGDLDDIPAAVERSVTGSLKRLGRQRVTLLQLHNSVTAKRGEEPTSLTVDDVLGPRGVLSALERERQRGRAAFIGLTGLGQAESLKRLIATGRFQTLQVPYNMLNVTAGRTVTVSPPGPNYGGIMVDADRQGMGVFAIRIFAGGALAGLPPSDYTHKTKFFTLDAYRRDEKMAAALARSLGFSREQLSTAAVFFALAHPAVSSAIIGFRSSDEIDSAQRAAESEPPQ